MILGFRSNLSRFLLDGATCTSPSGECYVVGDRLLIHLSETTDTVEFVLSKGSCSAHVVQPIPCMISGWVVVKFSDHAAVNWL